MTDKPNKFDLNSLINNIKSMINPTANTPNPAPEDSIGLKLAELSILVQELQQAYVEHGKQLGKVNKLFNEIYQNLEEIRAKEAVKSQEPPASTEVPKKED